MPTGEGDSPPYTDGDYYAFFFNGLAGLIDDAEQAGYDEDGIAHLREAYEFFGSEYRIRHPEKWQMPDNSN